MRRGVSFGGGQSSLGYLFESDEAPNPNNSVKNQRPPSIDDSRKSPDQATEKPISNNYHRAQGPNTGNFITGRPTTKVRSVPGGDSSLGYLFGDK